VSATFPVDSLALTHPGLTHRHFNIRRAGIPLALGRRARPGPRVVRRVEPKAGCVPAPISLRLPPDCWWFIQIMRSSSTAIPLPEDVSQALSRAPEVVVTPLPEPRFVVDLSRRQAEALRRWLQALLNQRSWSTAIPLPEDVLQALSRAREVVVTPTPEPRFVVDLSRRQAEALLRWLQALLDDLSQEGERWLTCLHCISRLTVAIRRSET
jgi:hypothetical protein